MMFVCLPGVYAVRPDTEILLASLEAEHVPSGARVLDLGTGTGALAVAAAARGAAVTAVDVSRRALCSAFLNGLLRGRRIQVRRGDLFAPVRDRSFDLIVSNPPYIPAPGAPSATLGDRSRSWDAGPAGRDVLDRLCRQSRRMLAPGGVVLIAQSSVADVARTCTLLRRSGLRAEVVARSRGGFGPVMRGRAPWLEQQGLIGPGTREEDLVVVRGARE
ncbi:HemK2/MTQ2 family protein methyltransferase [Catenulispora subtropica]|uniref:Methyltransferase n=1 Tax=Catenulispora subtropica TaxID=450798 RepID=A0ABN2T9M3_9ACTN